MITVSFHKKWLEISKRLNIDTNQFIVNYDIMDEEYELYEIETTISNGAFYNLVFHERDEDTFLDLIENHFNKKGKIK